MGEFYTAQGNNDQIIPRGWFSNTFSGNIKTKFEHFLQS